jgi:hypothetical protein
MRSGPLPLTTVLHRSPLPGSKSHVSAALHVWRGKVGSTGHRKPLSQCKKVTSATSNEETQKPADEADGDIAAAASPRCSGRVLPVFVLPFPFEVEAIGSDTPVAFSMPCISSCVLILLMAAVPVPSACVIVLTPVESEAKICVQSGHQGQLVTCSQGGIYTRCGVVV